jgi:hypothetical protein
LQGSNVVKKKQRQPPSSTHQIKQRAAAETPVEAFYAELQQAVNEVDWQNVKLPTSTDWKKETSVPAEDWGEILLE